MSGRSGPFWDAVQGPVPHRRAGATGDAGARDQFQTTLELHVSFLRPVRPGRIIGKGPVVHRDADTAFPEASLSDPDGTVTATATATARVIALSEARAAAWPQPMPALR